MVNRCNNKMRIPFQRTKDGILFTVRVQPRSSRKGIEGISGDVVKVKLTAPPHEGAANEQLIELLSEELGVRKNAIRIIRGHGSRNKVVEIRGLETLRG
jgi:uncharacterized protein